MMSILQNIKLSINEINLYLQGTKRMLRFECFGVVKDKSGPETYPSISETVIHKDPCIE